MRLLPILFLLVAQVGNAQRLLPHDRHVAPTLKEVQDWIALAPQVYGDSVLSSDHNRVNPHDSITGVVIVMNDDGALVKLRQFRNGRAEGTWLRIVHGDVTDLDDYTDGGQLSDFYRYDHQGRVYFCGSNIGCPPEYENSLFRGCDHGSASEYDSLGRLISTSDITPSGDLTQVNYYPSGAMAYHRQRGNASLTIEQWCPNGKRIGHLVSVRDAKTDSVVTKGVLVHWSSVEGSFYLLAEQPLGFKLCKYPNGRWTTHNDSEYYELQERLELVGDYYPDRMPVYPCSLKRR
jgi:hypothetical protein